MRIIVPVKGSLSLAAAGKKHDDEEHEKPTER
jgi:hypothetical protein